MLAISLLASLLLLEVGVRTFGFDIPRLMEPHPKLGWVHIAGARTRDTREGDGLIEINDLGLRDRPRGLQKPQGCYRIAVFGDSMTEGNQVQPDETFCYLLEERLRAGGKQAEVLNFGVTGYGTIQEYLYCRDVLARFHPDMVILAIFADNDVADCDPRLAYAATQAPFLSAIDSPCFDYSACESSYAGYRAEPVFTIRKWSAVYRVLRDRQSRITSSRSATAATVPKRYELYLESQRSEWAEAWKTVESVLVMLSREAAAAQVPLLLVNMPAGQVVTPGAWKNVLDRNPGMKALSFDLDGPTRRLAAFANSRGIAWLDPSDEFRSTSGAHPLFFGDVGHLTPRGHEVMAAALERFLLSRNLLTRSAANRANQLLVVSTESGLTDDAHK